MNIKGAVSFLQSNYITLLIALIGGLILIGIALTQTERTAAWIIEICEEYPFLPFCEQLSSVGPRDYQIAKASTEALVCAVDSVVLGEEDACVSNYKNRISVSSPGVASGSFIGMITGLITGAQTGVSPNYEMIEKEVWVPADVSYVTEELCREMCHEDICKGTYLCEVIESNVIQPGARGPRKCDCKARKSTETSVICSSPSFTYNPDSKQHDDFRFIFQDDIWKWKRQSPPGFDLQTYKPTCGRSMSESGLTQSVWDTWEDVFPNVIFSGSDNPASVGFGGLMDFDNCKSYETGIELFKHALKRNADGVYGSDDTLTISFSAGKNQGKSETFNKNNYEDIDEFVEDSMTCTAYNFQLPQEFEQYEEWIAAAGDPQFLVYFQVFPLEENSQWTGHSAWFESFGKIMFASFCVGHILSPIIKPLYGATRSLVSIQTIKNLKNGAYAIKNVQNKAKSLGGSFKGIMDFIIHPVKSTTGVVGKNIGRAKSAGRAAMNRAIVNHYKTPENFWSVAKVKVTAENAIEKYAEVKNAFTTVKNYERSNLYLAGLLDDVPMTPILKQLVKDQATDVALRTIKNPRFAAYMGTDTLASYYLSRIDSEIGKYTDIYDNSMVLQTSMVSDRLRKEYVLESEEILAPKKITNPSQEPIIDLKAPIILRKAEFFNSPTPFYLVSPCQADVDVVIDEVTCGLYTYDSISDTIICKSPEETNWWNDLKKVGYFPDCGSLPGWGDEEFAQKEMSYINDGINFELFPDEDVEIENEDLLCCDSDHPFGSFYTWLTYERCVAFGYSTGEMVGNNWVPTDESLCGPKPPDKVMRKMIKDPFYDITFYYDEDTGLVDYYKLDVNCDDNPYELEFEYDSDSGPSVWYKFVCSDDSNSECIWKFKITEPLDGNNFYQDYQPIRFMDGDDHVIFRLYGIDKNPHAYIIDMMDRFIETKPAFGGEPEGYRNYESVKKFKLGLAEIERYINDDYENRDDDTLTVHYPDGTSVKYKEVVSYSLYNAVYPCLDKPLRLITKVVNRMWDNSILDDVTCAKVELGEMPITKAMGEDICKDTDTEGNCINDVPDALQCHIDYGHLFFGVKQYPFWNTKSSVFFKLNENGEVENPVAFNSTRIPHIGLPGYSPSAYGKQRIEVVYNDLDTDGVVDGIGHYLYDISVNPKYGFTSLRDITFSVFNDQDGNGEVDIVSSNNCKINAVTLQADMDPYSLLPNYCYKKTYSTTLGLVGVTAAFGVSAITKAVKVGGFWGWVLATVVDCGIAFAEYKWGTPTWPGN